MEGNDVAENGGRTEKLEGRTVFEITVEDGVYATVLSWAPTLTPICQTWSIQPQL